MRNYKQNGKGYYVDLSENIAGKSVISSYQDTNPPIFAGDLTEGMQWGGSLLDRKIRHLENYIKRKGKYKLPKYVMNDLD